MNHTKRDIIIKLETLSRIPKNGKLKLANNEIEIYSNSWIEWLKRWGNGDGRNNTVDHLNSFFDHIILTTDDMMSYIENNDDAKNKANDLSAIALALANSIIGINNLRETYVKDEKTSAQLRFICEQYISIQYHKISDALDSYNGKLVPKLKSDIKDLINSYSPTWQARSPVISAQPSPVSEEEV
jgi:hypothetical protein